MANPHIAVIVPSFNEEGLIEACLKAIRAQTFKDYKLIVIDGHSKDDTAKIAKKYADMVIYDRRKGAGAARNLAVRRTKSEIVAFTDADTLVPRHWLKQISRHFGKKRVVAVGGALVPSNGTLLEALHLHFNNILFKILSLFGKPYLCGNNCAYRRSVFLKAGGFREDLTMLDDFELSLRVSRFGKYVFDLGIPVATSTRRMKKGQVSLILKYAKALCNLIFKNKIEIEYLRDR